MTKCKAKLSFSLFSGTNLISCVMGKEYDLEKNIAKELLKDGLVELAEAKSEEAPEVETEQVEKPKAKTRKKKSE